MAHHSSHYPQRLGRHHERDDSAEMLVKVPPKHKRIENDDTENRSMELEESLMAESEAVETILTRAVAAKDKTKQKKNVSFSTIQIRTYELILGDNPDCSFPLSLGWKYSEDNAVDLNDYECHHHPKRMQARIEDCVHVGQLLGINSPLVDPLMISAMRPLTLHERRVLLRAQGHSEQSLRKAERRRRIELSLQWASGHFPKQDDFPYSQRFFLNYVL